VTGAARLVARLTPRSSRDRILGREEGILRISLTAPPVDDQANQSLVRFLAKSLGVSASDVSIERGRTSRLKTVAVQGLTEAELEGRIERLLGG
jgi:uncharacterized protein (TIGR00251 family)